MAKLSHSQEDDIILQAEEILYRRVAKSQDLLDSPTATRRYLRTKLALLEHEVFGVLWVNAQNRLICDEQLFRGTLTQTSVYPREVLKSAIAKNACACILYHNHPSGAVEQSYADEKLTNMLKDTLKLVDINVLDHIIVAGMETISFAERGLI